MEAGGAGGCGLGAGRRRGEGCPGLGVGGCGSGGCMVMTPAAAAGWRGGQAWVTVAPGSVAVR